MKFSRTDNGDETTIQIGGALDAMTAPELRPTIDELVQEKRQRVTVDLSDLVVVDSSGVAVIVSLYKRVRAFGVLSPSFGHCWLSHASYASAAWRKRVARALSAASRWFQCWVSRS